MKEINSLLRQLAALNIKLWLENGRLQYSAPKGTFTQELRDKLINNKTEIIDFLSKTAPSENRLVPSGSPIQTVSRDQDLPLSFAQQRLWFLDQLENSKSTTYNMPPTVIKLNGQLNADLLESSLNTIVKRHEILRTYFKIKDDHPIQIISDQFTLKLKRIDLQAFDKDQQDKELSRITRQEAETLFNLSKGPLLRATLITFDKATFVVIISMHHIISDGWSSNLFVQELAQLYNAFVSGKPSPLKPLEIQYVDYALWQRQKLSGEFLEKQKQYWKNQLSGAPALLELPLDHPRPPIQRFHGKTEYFYLPKTFTQELKQFSQQAGVTLFMSLFASFAALLYRYTGSEDILVGTPVANRNHDQIEELIGFFVNTIVLRVHFQESLSFEDLLEQVKNTALEAYQHQEIPFEQVVEELQIVRDLSYTPIFQVMFILLNTPFEEIELNDLTINLMPTENINAVYELIMVMEESSNGIEGKVRYNTDIFETATIKRLIGHFMTLLKGIITNAKQTVLELPLVTQEEHQQFQDWHKHHQSFPEDRCLHHIFETQVTRSPDAIALIFEDQCLTYQELNQKANQIAHYLQSKGVTPDTLVGICVDRSLDMVIGILGILKAGGAYLPIDPTYPDERIVFTLEDANVSIVLSHSTYGDKFSAINAEIIYLDQENFQSMTLENPTSNVSKNNLTYVIYTSGSTGKPKGVLITHHNVTRLFSATQAWYHFNHHDVWTLFHSYAFDFSVWEIWGALLYGGKLIIVPYWISRSPDAFYDLLCKHQVTVLNQTPSAFNQLQKAEEQKGICSDLNLRFVIFGGEALEFQTLKPWFKRHGDKKPQLINMYGITETTVHVTYHPLNLNDLDKSKSLIGYPIPDLRAYILDNRLCHKPVGIPGELFIGGAGVAKGYLNRPELTNQRFIANPFHQDMDATLYKTGDLARFLPDGSLEYLGRIDNQVKIRGFRIELGEIESVLVQHPLVRNTLVIGSKINQNYDTSLRLIAYVEIGTDQNVSSSELRTFLTDKLPEYMIPSIYIMMDTFPLTANGKIDRRALPEPDVIRPDLETTYVPPQTKAEKRIASMWKEIIGLDQIGLHDNFFDLGGDSIKGAIFINKLQKQLNKIIYVVAIFEAPTIAEFINYLKEHYPEVMDSIDDQSQSIKVQKVQKINALDFIKFRKIIHPLNVSQPLPSKNPQAIFVLSPPRSGSTLLRVLLGGHPLLFAPPELELLSFNTLQERTNAFSGRNSFWLEGVIRAMMGIKGYDADQAKLEMQQYEKDNLTTQQMYLHMQTWLDNQILVDKTPSYALDINILQQAEQYFENPLYIHLMRHPYGMINSFEQAKLDQIFFLYDHHYSTRELAELTWLQSHVNILAFLENIPSSRQHTVTFENMTGQTETVINELCDFLNLDFHPDMLKPYQEKQKRMTDGIYKESRMLGDVKFLDHKEIEARVADRWRANYSHDFLGDITWQIAELLGYKNDLSSSPDKKIIDIHRIPRTDHLPISFAQKRLWFLDQYEEESTTYNISIALQLNGHLRIDILKKSLQAILDRHESLQSTFHSENGNPVVKLSKRPLQFDQVDLCHLPDDQRDIDTKALIDEEFNRPFHLSEGPLFRSRLIQQEKDVHILLVSMHHIVSDGWSIGVIINDWTILYNAFSEGLDSPLPELPIQYVDYANWQKQWLQGEEYNRQVNYWKKQLKGIPELLELPTDFRRPPVQTFKGTSLHFSLPSELTQQLKALSQSANCTLFMTLISGFSILMAKYSGQDDIVLGSPIANRNHKDIESLIGFFVNTLVLRHDLSNNLSFNDFLQQNRNVILEAYAHQDISFEQLVEELQPTRSLSHAPLFQVLFVLQNAPMGKLELPDLSIIPINQDSAISKFDLSMILEVNDETSEIDGTVEFNTSLFHPDTIKRLISHYSNLLQAIVKDPGQLIYQYEIMHVSERQTIIYKWNETGVSYAKDQCIHDLFEQQVEKTPDKTAIIFENQTITYRELNDKANQLAHHLRSLHVQTEDLVGIYMDRSIEMVIGLLGILKSGGAYVPLDPTYPIDRIQYMISDSETKILLTQSDLLEKLSLNDIQSVCLDNYESALTDINQDNLGKTTGSTNLAYVIYTSGSTGKPKGVMLTHQSVNNLLQSMGKQPGLSEHDILMAVTTISFDISVLDLFLTLTSGAKMILANDEMIKDGYLLFNRMKEYQVTVLQATPATWKILLSCGWEKMDQLRAFCGGEALTTDLASQMLEKCKDVWNLYGPTETTVYSAGYKIKKNKSGISFETPQPIGRPIANTELYILDRFNQPLPVGIFGELHIGGDGLARGYFKRPELTAEKFIKNPFSDDPDALMYKTGDLVRYLPDGNIEYSCRIDNQVKIRGYRIELGEIESLLSRHPAVKEAVVIVKADQAGDKSLVAYIIPQQDECIDTSELRSFLSQGLPVYMVPSMYISLEKMPLTPNGKVNRLALPDPDEYDFHRGQSVFVAPRDTVEIQLARIWENVLKRHPVGIRDNFFDLGGHSLMAVRLMAQIEEAFNRHLPLSTLFKNGNIELLANHIRHRQDDASWSSLVCIQPDGSQTPFFCVPGAGGNVLYFQELAMHLGKERPFYALQPPGLDGITRPLKTIEELASHYITTIKTVQKTGPYYMGGHSFGGLVAFEMTQQLARQGEHVKLSAILDCPSPVYSQPTGEDWDETRWLTQIANIISHLYGKDMGITEEHFKDRNDEEKLELLHNTLKACDFLPKEAKLDHFKGFVDVYKTNLMMTPVSDKKIVPINLVLFRSTDRQPEELEHDHSDEIRNDPSLGWHAYLSKDVDICMIPGDHLTMLTDPHVKELARLMNQYLGG